MFPATSNLPISLPLIDYLDNKYQITHQQPFKNTVLFAIQHLLGSTVPLLLAIEKGGVNKHDVYLVGKAYSTHPVVMSYLKDHGRHVLNAIMGYSEDVPYDMVLEDNIRHTFRKLIDKFKLDESSTKILLLDDAGKGIRILHEEFPRYAHYFKCVEQTTRGIREIEDIELKCPVVNVARSWAKTSYEAPLIAQSMVQELLHALERWQFVFTLTNHTILLFGYGTVGEYVCTELTTKGFSVLVFDTNQARLERANESGYQTLRNYAEALSSVGMVVGCTGTPHLSNDELRALQPGTLLVNMASSDLEFAAWRFRKAAIIVHETVLPSDELVHTQLEGPIPWRCLYQITVGNTGFYLANGGFPIDFSGAMDPIPPSDIQLTRALLLAAALQAVHSEDTGIHKLNDEVQHLILGEYGRLRS